MLVKRIQLANPTKIPQLKHNLEAQLSKSEFSFMRLKLCQPENFDFSKIPEYKSSKFDPELLKLAKENNCKFFSSTSSFTSILAKFYCLVSNDRRLSFEPGPLFAREPRRFTKTLRAPTSCILTRMPYGGYSIDYERSKLEDEESNPVMMKLGHSIERQLCNTEKEFEYFTLDCASDELMCPINEENTFNYTQVCLQLSKFSNFLLRSQIDCVNQSLDKTFDLKSRATFPIRMDPYNYRKFSNFEFTKRNTLFNSPEREYYDILRSAGLKWLFQAKLGCMDGLFVAYHNVATILGVEYIPVTRLEQDLIGGSSDALFEASIESLDQFLGLIVNRWKNIEYIRLSLAKTSSGLDIYVEPSQIGFDETTDMELGEMGLWKYHVTSKSFVDGVNVKFPVGKFDVKLDIKDVTEISDTRILQSEWKEARSRSSNLRDWVEDDEDEESLVKGDYVEATPGSMPVLSRKSEAILSTTSRSTSEQTSLLTREHATDSPEKALHSSKEVFKEYGSDIFLRSKCEKKDRSKSTSPAMKPEKGLIKSRISNLVTKLKSLWGALAGSDAETVKSKNDAPIAMTKKLHQALPNSQSTVNQAQRLAEKVSSKGLRSNLYKKV